MSRSWTVRRGAKTSGPFSDQQLKSLARGGKLYTHDHLSLDGGASWILASTVRGLFSTPSASGAVQTDAGTAQNKAGMRDGSSAVAQTPSSKGPLSDSASSGEQVPQPSDTDADNRNAHSHHLPQQVADICNMLRELWQSADATLRVCIVGVALSLWTVIGPFGVAWPLNESRIYLGHFREQGGCERYVSRLRDDEYRVIEVCQGRVSSDRVFRKTNDTKHGWELTAEIRNPKPGIAAGVDCFTWTWVTNGGWWVHALGTFGLPRGDAVLEEQIRLGNYMGRNFTDPGRRSLWRRVGSRQSPK